MNHFLREFLSFTGKTKILHLTWFALFLSFFMWFNHAPLLASLRDTFQLTDQQIKTLLILNVALTIPARIIVGMLVDAVGPKRMFSSLLFLSSLLCFGFALSSSFEQLALMRFLLGFSGAGFVIGIRLISEWFPARQLGTAEGIYGGWGNFGSAGAAIILPSVALAFGGDDGWRYATGMTGVLAMIYAAVFFFSVSDTPKGSTYFKPKKSGAMEVTSKADFFLYLFMNVPMYAALAVLAWKVGPENTALLSEQFVIISYVVLVALYLFQTIRVYQINKKVFTHEVADFEKYKFKQVAVLNIAYMVTFGSELAMISMLPLFFNDVFGLPIITSGLFGSIFGAMVIVARPTGGWLSDHFGRRKSLTVILIGFVLGYLLMSQITSDWPVALAVLATMFCGLFVHFGTGAVFAVVPLVKRRLTGQVAGMTGAYGNVGGVIFLTVLSFVNTTLFFYVIAGVGAVTWLIVFLFLEEPKGHMSEVMPDGTVQMIDVN